MSFSVANFEDVRDQNHVFESLFAVRGQDYVLTGEGEAALGWLNAEVLVSAKAAGSPRVTGSLHGAAMDDRKVDLRAAADPASRVSQRCNCGRISGLQGRNRGMMSRTRRSE